MKRPGTVKAICEVYDQLVVRFHLTEDESALLRDCGEVLNYHHFGWGKGERYDALRSSIVERATAWRAGKPQNAD